MLLRVGTFPTVTSEGYQRLWSGRQGTTAIELCFPTPEPQFARRIEKTFIGQNDRAALLVGAVYASPEATTTVREEMLRAWLDKFCRTGERGFLNSIEGSFTLVLIDLADLRVLVAGDLRSLFPIYHMADDGRLAVSWRISAIQQTIGGKQLSPGSVLSALTNGLVLGTNTYDRRIRRLSPGGFILFENGRVTVDRYWRRDFSRAGGVTADEFAACIGRVVTTELARAGDDCVLALSGGIDSRALLAVLARAGVKLDSVTWGCDRLDLEYGDFQAGGKLARHVGLPHRAIPLDPDRLGAHLKDLVDASEGMLLHVGSLPHGETLPRELGGRYRTVLFGAQCFGMGYRGYGLKQALLAAGLRTGGYLWAAASLLRPEVRRQALDDYRAQLAELIRPYRSLSPGDIQDITDYTHTSPGMEAAIHWIWLRHVYPSCPLDTRPTLELSNRFTADQRFNKQLFTDTIQKHLWPGEAWPTNTKHSRIDWDHRIGGGGRMATDMARLVVEPGPFFELFDRDQVLRWLRFLMPTAELPAPARRRPVRDLYHRALWTRTRPHQLAYLAVLKLAKLA